MRQDHRWRGIDPLSSGQGIKRPELTNLLRVNRTRYEQLLSTIMFSKMFAQEGGIAPGSCLIRAAKRRRPEVTSEFLPTVVQG
jgi:hypothetical protein